MIVCVKCEIGAYNLDTFECTNCGHKMGSEFYPEGEIHDDR